VAEPPPLSVLVIAVLLLLPSRPADSGDIFHNRC
jgi:hypothetical protein